jgi:1-deoxy-D-xylulose-5-phosphate reductoisomerase
MSSRKKVSIFGVTGSVGTSAAEVILASPGLFEVQTVTAGSNAEKLADTAIRLKAKKAIIAQEDQLEPLKQRLSGFGIAAEAGKQAAIKAAAEPADLLLAATVGFEGLRPILAALENGVNVAIANKEPLVAAGPLLLATARKSGARILPVDSEHNAIFQVWEERKPRTDRKDHTDSLGRPLSELDSRPDAKGHPGTGDSPPQLVYGSKNIG